MSKSMHGSPPTHPDGLRDWAAELAPFGKRTLKVIWDISNKCNLRCRMCHFSFDHVFHQEPHHTSPADFERIAASALPLAHTLILSAGNEPLMSPHFIDILKVAARYSVPQLLFLTNGQLLSPAVADAILETGVTQVQISIDGATRETYEYIRRGARFDRLLRNLEYLSARKIQLGRRLPQLQFNVVLMRRNLEELPLFVDLAERLGVEWIAARHLLMMRGLHMEGETLMQERDRANLHFQRFFERVEQSQSVSVIGFPDFFNGQQFVSATNPGQNPVPIPPPRSKPEDSPRQTHSTQPAKVARGVCAKIVREIRRIPRNLRRAVSRETPKVAPPKPKKLAALPFGSIDHPADKEPAANNAIQLEGWALDRIQIARVSIEREPFAHERVGNSRGLIDLGDARIVNGSRPDVRQVFPQYPHLFRAGWTFELRREMLSANNDVRVTVHAIAHGIDGRSAEIGQRRIAFSATTVAKPYLFCSRPFDSLFIDSKSDVWPYPDCRPEHPYGSLAEEKSSLRDIWHGEAFRELRQRIIDRNPPPMCLTCAHFINRNVDDPQYFLSR